MSETLPAVCPGSVIVPNQPGELCQSQQTQTGEAKPPAPIKPGSDEDYQRYLGIELHHAHMIGDNTRKAHIVSQPNAATEPSLSSYAKSFGFYSLLALKTRRASVASDRCRWNYSYHDSEYRADIDEARGPHVWTFLSELTQQTGRPVAKLLEYRHLARFSDNHHRRQFAPTLNALEEAEAVQALTSVKTAKEMVRKQPSDLMLMVGSAVLATHATIQATKRGAKNTWNWLKGEKRLPTKQPVAKSARLA